MHSGGQGFKPPPVHQHLITMDNPPSRTYRHIRARRIAGALGAEIEGVDAARPLMAEAVAEIRQAFLDHLVIFLRNQKLTPREQLAFAQQFGQPGRRRKARRCSTTSSGTRSSRSSLAVFSGNPAPSLSGTTVAPNTTR